MTAALRTAAIALPILAGTFLAPAADDGHHHHPAGVNLLTGEGVTLGDTVIPVLYLSTSAGATTAGSPSELAVGHHDPQDTLTLQTLEPGVTVRLGEYLEAFVIGAFTSDADRRIDASLEEAFLRVHHLPAGFGLRAGRFLNAVGFHNASHNHAWHFVNNHLLNGRLLQEGELATEGLEITWRPGLGLPFDPAVALSHGRVPSHGLAHAHAHAHADFGEHEAPFDVETALFDQKLTTASLTFASHDRHQRLRLSSAWGRNAAGRHTQILSVAHQATVVENLTWHNEIAYRRFGTTTALDHDDHDEHDEHEDHEDHGAENRSNGATLDEFAALTSLVWQCHDDLSAGLRLGYASGIAEAGRDQRLRLSPNLTYRFGPANNAHLRLQLDVDHSPTRGSDTSAWLQFGYSWGGGHHGHSH